MPEEESHKTTAELEAHVITVEERCVEAVEGIGSKLDEIKKGLDDRLDEIDERMDNQSDEINRSIPLQMSKVLHRVDKLCMISEAHEKKLQEADDNKRYFSRFAITTFVMGAGSIIWFYIKTSFGAK